MTSTDCTEFERHVFPVTESGCWIWMKRMTVHGYGVVSKGKQCIRAHRHAWTIYRGPIPDGVFVCHHCDVPCCVNPDHLFLGTPLDNMRDKMAKGRARVGEDRPGAKLTYAAVQAIRASKESDAELAKKFAVSATAIWMARHRRTYRACPEAETVS